MSILIKDMKIPTSCDDCRLNNGISCYAVPEYTEDCVVGRTDDRPDWCPLIELPPHGRLIDADALIKSDRLVGKLMMFDGEYVYTQSEIDRAPTIIEAERELSQK